MNVEHERVCKLTKVDARSARNLLDRSVRVSPSLAGYSAPRLINWNSAAATVRQSRPCWGYEVGNLGFQKCGQPLESTIEL